MACPAARPRALWKAAAQKRLPRDVTGEAGWLVKFFSLEVEWNWKRSRLRTRRARPDRVGACSVGTLSRDRRAGRGRNGAISRGLGVGRAGGEGRRCPAPRADRRRLLEAGGTGKSGPGVLLSTSAARFWKAGGLNLSRVGFGNCYNNTRRVVRAQCAPNSR